MRTKSQTNSVIQRFISSLLVFLLTLTTFNIAGFGVLPQKAKAGTGSSVTWITTSHFLNNGAPGSNYTGATSRSQVDTRNDEVKLGLSIDVGTGEDGALIIDGTTASNNTLNGSIIPGGPFNSSNPLVIDSAIPRPVKIYNFTSVTLQNGAVVTHSQATGAGTGNEGMEFKAQEAFIIDSSSKIDVTGKGYGAALGPGAGSSNSGNGNTGQIYAGPGGGGYGNWGGAGGNYFSWSGMSGGAPYGSPDGVEYMGSGGGTYRYYSGGGSGGGRVKITASNIVVNGSIQANGTGGPLGTLYNPFRDIENGGGGSGGGIYLAASTVTISGILSAAGGGGASGKQWVGGEQGHSGDNGYNGYGGSGGSTYSYSGGSGAGPSSSPGSGGRGGGTNNDLPPLPGNPGSAGGGGAFGSGEGAGGGGAAGRIAIHYGSYNGVSNKGATGYYGPAGSEATGPYAYYTHIPAFKTYGTIGEAGAGLRADAGSGIKAKWSKIRWNADIPLGTAIEVAVKATDDINDWMGNYSAWQSLSSGDNLSDDAPPALDISSIASASQGLEIKVRLTSEDGSNTPTLSELGLDYETIDAPAVDNLNQYRSDKITEISTGWSNETSAVFKVLSVQGVSDSSSVRAQFEIKPAATPFDGTGLVDGNMANPGLDSSFTKTGLADGSSYHWRARLVDDKGRISPWAKYNDAASFSVSGNTVSWITAEDFRNNASTSGIATTNNQADLTSSPGDIKIASPKNFGSGADGALAVSSGAFNINAQTNGYNERTQPDAWNSRLSSLTADSATLVTTPPAGALAQGDEVMLISLRGSPSGYVNVGNYEFLRVQSVSSNVVSFASNKTKSYGDSADSDDNAGSSQYVMLQRVPNYTDVKIEWNSTLTCDAWDGAKGGVLAFRSKGTVTVGSSTSGKNGSVNRYAYIGADGKGHRGGTGVAYNENAIAGETYFGGLYPSGGVASRNGYPSPSIGGGGGGAGDNALTDTLYTGSLGSIGPAGGGGGGAEYSWATAGGGGGGGYGSVGLGGQGFSSATRGTIGYGASGSGTSGGKGGDIVNYVANAASGGGGGGGTYSDSGQLDNKAYLGAGGGAGGGAMIESSGNYYYAKGSAGGAGGGIVFISANTVNVYYDSYSVYSDNGIITAAGGKGQSGISGGGGSLSGSGGGGAGGSVIIQANAISSESEISSKGGDGGDRAIPASHAGGSGGAGRTYAEYFTLSGNEPASNYWGTTALPNYTTSSLGGLEASDVGLRYDAEAQGTGVRARWSTFSSNGVLNATGNNAIKFAVRVSNDGTTWSELLGPSGSAVNWSNNFFGESNNPADSNPVSNSLANIPTSRFLDICVRLESDGSNTPILNDVTLTHDATNTSLSIEQAPPTGSLAIDTPVAGYVNSQAVNLSLNASDTGGSGLAQMRFSNDGSTWSNWQDYLPAISWTLSTNDGPKTVSAQYKDKAGNVSDTATDNIILDATAPSSNISTPSKTMINSLSIISGTAVDLTSGIKKIEASVAKKIDGVDYYWDGTSWQTGSAVYLDTLVSGALPNYSWTLDQALPAGDNLEDGDYTIKARAIDNANNTEPLGASVSFRYDTAPPNAPRVKSPTHPDQAKWHKSNCPTIFFLASDSGLYPTAVDGYSYVLDNNPGTIPAKVKTVAENVNQISFAAKADGIWYFHVRAVDVLGNWGPAAHFVIKIDIGPPLVGGILSNSKHYRRKILLLAASNDNLSGISKIDFYHENTLIYTSSWSLASYLWDSTPYNGLHTISIKALDGAGNIGTYSRMIKVDNYRPRTLTKGKVKIRRGRIAKLYWKVYDPYTSNRAYVTLKLQKRLTRRYRINRRLRIKRYYRTVKLIRYRWTRINKFRYYKLRIRKRGLYRYLVYATDQAGNKQSKIARNLVIVR